MSDGYIQLMNPLDLSESDEHDSTHRSSGMDTAHSKPAASFTMEEAIEKLGFGKFQVKLVGLTGMYFMADAMEATLLSVLSVALQCEWLLQSWQEALISTVVFIGALLSSSSLGTFSDKFGRRVELFYCGCCLSCFTFLSAFAPNFYWMVVFRVLVGMSLGGAPQSSLLLAELLPKKQRAKGITAINVFWAVGSFLQSALALLVMPQLGWSYLLGISAAIVFVICCCCYKWMPESPRYDLVQGDLASALKTLKKIARDNGKTLPEGTLLDPLYRQQAERGQIQGLFTKSLRTNTILLGGIAFLGGFSYFGTILLSTSIFEKEGNSKHGPACFLECKVLSTSEYQSLMWTSFAEVPGLALAALMLDFIGRKKTMALTFAVYAVSVFLVVASSSRVLLTALLFVARGTVNVVLVTLFIQSAEVNPTAFRGVGVGFCVACVRTGALITPFVAQVLLKASRGLALSIYGAAGVMGVIMALLLPLETAGTSLNEGECSSAEADENSTIIPKATASGSHSPVE